LDIVINASPLILLGKINRLDLLNRLFSKVYIPSAVLQEVQAIDKSEMELEVTGTLGILLKAHKQGLIDDVLQEIDKLKHEGMYLSDSIIEKIKSSL